MVILSWCTVLLEIDNIAEYSDIILVCCIVSER